MVISAQVYYVLLRSMDLTTIRSCAPKYARQVVSSAAPARLSLLSTYG